MFSDSTTPGQQLNKSDTVTTHGRGRGGDHRFVAALQDDVVVAVCQDLEDCWLHVFDFSHPWRHQVHRLPQASAIDIYPAEKSRGPGHFTLTLDSPSAVLEGCVDDSLQLSQLQGRPLLKNQSLLSASGMGDSLATSSSTLIFFRFKKKRRVIMIDSTTQQIKLVERTRNCRLIWEWPQSPFETHQFERLYMFAYPNTNLRDTCQEHFLAVCDRARRQIIILSLDHGHKLCSLDISSHSEPQIIFVHKHYLFYIAAGIPYCLNLNSFNIQLQNVTKEKQIAKGSFWDGKHSRGSASTPYKTDDDEGASCIIRRRELVGKGRKNISKQKVLKHGVDQKSIEASKFATLRLCFLQKANNIYCLVSQGIPRMKTLLCSQYTEMGAESAPVTQNALPQNDTMTDADYFKQIIFDCTTAAAKTTGKCLAALLGKLREHIRQNLTCDRDTLFQNVGKTIEELLTTFKQIVAISCAVAREVYNAVPNDADLASVTSRTKDSSQSLSASNKQVHAQPDVKDPKRPQNVHEKGTGKTEGPLEHIALNKPFQSTVQPQALSTCNQSRVDTEGKSQNLFQNYSMNKVLKDAELSRRQRAMNESGSTEISHAVSTCKSTIADTEQEQPNLYPMNEILREAELARRQRRGEKYPIP